MSAPDSVGRGGIGRMSDSPENKCPSCSPSVPDNGGQEARSTGRDQVVEHYWRCCKCCVNHPGEVVQDRQMVCVECGELCGCEGCMADSFEATAGPSAAPTNPGENQTEGEGEDRFRWFFEDQWWVLDPDTPGLIKEAEAGIVTVESADPACTPRRWEEDQHIWTWPHAVLKLDPTQKPSRSDSEGEGLAARIEELELSLKQADEELARVTRAAVKGPDGYDYHWCPGVGWCPGCPPSAVPKEEA